jgi:hypothetical protein
MILLRNYTKNRLRQRKTASVKETRMQVINYQINNIAIIVDRRIRPIFDNEIDVNLHYSYVK